MEARPTGAETVHWNLSDLYTDFYELEADLGRGAEEARTFEETYRGRLADLNAGELAEAMRLLEAFQDRMGKAFTFAYLRWVTATEDAERGALLQKVREAYTEAGKKIIFFELEWAALEDKQAEALLADVTLAPFRHYLEVQRLHKKHLLTEPEEKILADKSITGAVAWSRFFDETIASARFELDGKWVTEQEVLAQLYVPDRTTRRRAALSLTEGLDKRKRELTYIFNTLLADKSTDDRLRGFETWLSSRNLSNEISDEVVQALIDSVTGRYDLAERFYRLKKRLLGLEEMMDYDRYAPILEVDSSYTWDAARSMVLEAYHTFHPTIGGVAQRFFDENWIDAPVVAGKRGGAFSHGAVPSAHPYILMNYTGRIRDVQTLAHELGHGVHQYLARRQGVFHADTPLTTAETASVFGEMLVFNRLMDAEKNPSNRLAMLIGKIDDTMATVFRQVAMNRFEDRIHTARREEGELSTERFSDMWMETQRRMFRGSVMLGEHYRLWWSYIPHFLHTPGYVYAYAFGELLVLALYEKYRREGASFTEAYIGLLEAGGSDWPHTLVGRLGIDLTDLSFWNQGLKTIGELIGQAENLANSLGYTE